MKSLNLPLANSKRLLYTAFMMSQTKANSMTCSACQIECRRFGKHRNGLQRFRCAECGKTYTEEHEKPLGEMTVPMEKAVLALKLLVEGSSIRTVERITELHRDTICRLLVVAGEKCATIIAKQVRNLHVKDVECDEVWGYIGKKEGHKTAEDENELGDAYCFVAVERNTKLVINFSLGKRNQRARDAFIEGLRDALEPRHRFQITTDGFRPYISAISTTLGHRVDFAQLIKVYRAPSEGEGRYSPQRLNLWRWSQSSETLILLASAPRLSRDKTSQSQCRFAA